MAAQKREKEEWLAPGRKVRKDVEAAGEEEPALRDQIPHHRGWKAMPYVIGNETFEKLGTLGTSSNLVVYLTTVFRMSSVSAATILLIFNGTTNLSPILGAFISDSYLGRYAVLGVASVASLTGMLLLTLTAAIPNLHPRCRGGTETCGGPSPPQLAVLFLSFFFLVVGAGGIRPCNLAFGADQFDHRTESGRKGINSFFNWYYFTFTIAMMISSTVIIYVQSDVDWGLGLGIPTILMFFSCTVFFLGSKIYVKVKPEGSPFSNVARVLMAAWRKRNLELSDGQQLTSFFNPPLPGGTVRAKLSHTDQFRCLDKASIIARSDEVNPNGLASNQWRLCSLQHVEEVKCIVRIIPIWLAGMVYGISLTQEWTYVIFQALQSDRHLFGTSFEIPAGSFVTFNMLALTIWIPIYDRIIIPGVQRITGVEGGFTLLQRMGIGIVLSIIAMIVAAILEEKRRSVALQHANLVSSMSSMWLIPQLMLLGVSEAFNLIGQVEFFYKQFPENMRSVAGAFLFCGLAISSYLSSFMVMIVHRLTGGEGRKSWLDNDLNKGRLDLFYYLCAAVSFLNFVYFIFCARWYKYKILNGGLNEISMEKSSNF
ncbi:putative peptide/nitrate transporter [Apostasia shenzhenica]|uniref:Putative peptide/nitrate transporter n=1 Tax=Apostasia shenzhenica TaxID=1088818 RepID=A0A2H9ZYH7_9ASPA|nr:putative peptide/nitrate transporter [Apostasia shenzhenica]